MLILDETQRDTTGVAVKMLRDVVQAVGVGLKDDHMDPFLVVARKQFHRKQLHLAHLCYW